MAVADGGHLGHNPASWKVHCTAEIADDRDRLDYYYYYYYYENVYRTKVHIKNEKNERANFD